VAIEALLARYGLLGIFLGSGIEGEAVVITGGVLAHRGLVPLWAAMVASACGSCIVDQIWFFIGRHFRRYRWVERITGKPAFARALTFLERYPTAFIFGFRFVYGMRTISPVAIGTTSVPTARFMILNAVAAAIWGPLFTWIGFAFGKALDPLIHHVQKDAFRVILAFAVVAIVAGLVAAWRQRATRQTP
jgi:membrane protein DedA with SNARE-associated domain